MKLKCLMDICPQTGRCVDMRRCCGEHSWSKACKYYGEDPWSEYMFATCNYPHAQAHIMKLPEAATKKSTSIKGYLM